MKKSAPQLLFLCLLFLMYPPGVPSYEWLLPTTNCKNTLELSWRSYKEGQSGRLQLCSTVGSSHHPAVPYSCVLPVLRLGFKQVLFNDVFSHSLHLCVCQKIKRQKNFPLRASIICGCRVRTRTDYLLLSGVEKDKL